MTTHVMLDLETLGTSANATIIAIGAVEFDKHGPSPLGVFYEKVDPGADQAGSVTDQATVDWWATQSDAAREVLHGGAKIQDVLGHFSTWLLDLTPDLDVKVWGNGAAFDNTILAQAYKRFNLNCPWRYWNDRCYRTVKNLAPQINLTRIGTHHNAIDDATSQVNHLVTILNTLNLPLG